MPNATVSQYRQCLVFLLTFHEKVSFNLKIVSMNKINNEVSC